MDKIRLIKEIHKILYVFEENDYDKYYSCLSHQIVKLNGYENDILEDNAELLKGLRNMEQDVTHFDVRQTVLHIMNDIDRRL